MACVGRLAALHHRVPPHESCISWTRIARILLYGDLGILNDHRIFEPKPKVPVYRNNVIVERYRYVAPRPVYPSWHHRHYRPHPRYHQPGVHWGFSFSH